MLIWVGIAGWARAVSLQWVAGVVMTASLAYFLFMYAL